MGVREELSGIVRSFLGDDDDVEVSGMQRVSGGDINDAYVLALKNGRRLFLKGNTKKNIRFFQTEETGLSAIRQTQTIRVPEVLGSGIAGDRSFFLMEYLEAGRPGADYWERFAHDLAAMHRADPSKWTPYGKYGFVEDNFIGAGEQVNTIHTGWVSFFRDCRLQVQFTRAQHCFEPSGRKQMQSLLDHLEEYLAEPEYPSLLHGDLWGGNYVTGPDGYAWLIDPAVYVGHAEADLAMTELFGGFAPAFYDSYREAGDLLPGYADRRDLYNLYHLLNHLNLFGSSYYGSVMRILRRYARI